MSEALLPDLNYFAKLADLAGQIIYNNLGQPTETRKDDGSPQTETDVEINQIVAKRFAADFPELRFMGEESEKTSGGSQAKYTVICDPCDGSIPHTCGIPVAAFCLTLLDEMKPIKSVVMDPFTNRMWFAERGRGCFLGGVKQRVSEHALLDGAKVVIMWWKGAKYRLNEVCQLLINHGALWMNPASLASFGGLLASGFIDATIFPGQSAWETPAVQLMVEEAGGIATDIYGNALVYGQGGEMNGHIIANGKSLHQKILEMVNKCQ